MQQQQVAAVAAAAAGGGGKVPELDVHEHERRRCVQLVAACLATMSTNLLGKSMSGGLAHRSVGVG